MFTSTGKVLMGSGVRNGAGACSAGTVFRVLAVVMLLVLGVLGVGAGSASAQAPMAWWGLSQRAQPTQIQPGLARDEVQEITVAASAGQVVLTEPESLEATSRCVSDGRPAGECLELIKQVCFAYNAEASQVQSRLEAKFGAGTATVEGGPGDGEGTKPYVVRFEGGLGDQPIPPFVTTEASYFACPQLKGKATARQLVEGRPDGRLIVVAENRGDTAAEGAREPITVSDTLPPGLKAVSVQAYGAGNGASFNRKSAQISCSEDPGSESTVSCVDGGSLGAYQTVEMVIGVAAQSGAAATETNTLGVSGGKATAPMRIQRPVHIGGEEKFGVEEAQFTPETAAGAPATQAGSHPFQLTSVISFNENGEAEPVALPKDINVLSPAGLVGNPTPLAQCTDAQFAAREGAEQTACPADTTIGVADIAFNLNEQVWSVREPVFNMVPNKGEPARFAFYAVALPVMLDTSVRTGGDYGVTVSSANTVATSGVLSSSVTLWGVPGDPLHDHQRGYDCLYEKSSCKLVEEATPPPFLSLPTSCTGPLQASVNVNSWAEREHVLSYGMSEPPPAMGGCNHLPFAPEISVAPDVENAASPSGLTVGVHVPQRAALNASGLSEATVKDTTVVLPAGMTLNPGGADGLQACSEAEIGFLGKDETDPARNLFTAGLSDPFCPDGAKVGTVKIETPLLPNALEGAVYLATPAPAGEAGENPFDGLVSMYIVAEDPVSGVLVKLPGQVQLCERAGQVLAGASCQAAGQLISTFKDTPQLPFEDLTLHFFGGGRAPLATPARCGSYTTTASIAPWSGSAPATPSSTFNIIAGPNGSSVRSPARGASPPSSTQAPPTTRPVPSANCAPRWATPTPTRSSAG